MIRSFRFRLTLWYLAFFSVLFVLFSILLYGVLSRSLEKRLDESLAVEANTESAMFLDEFTENKGDIPQAALDAVGGMRLRASLVAILEGESLLASSTPLASGELHAIAMGAGANPAQDFVLDLPHTGPNGARAALRRTPLNGHTYLVAAVEPRDEMVADLAMLRQVLLIALPLLIAIAGAGGFWLASRQLAPIGWIADQARRITDSNLDTRIEIGAAVDELATLSASFNELLSRLHLSFTAMRRFVADASHELRTPISVIRGEADVALSHERSAAEYREALATIQDESRRLSRLVDDLLNLARADAGRVKLRVEEFYLNDLLADCCRSVQRLAAARGVTVNCRSGADDVGYRGDEELMRRLVMNLLDNAIRYTPQGGKVDAALESFEGELRIRVSDTGIGIPPDAAPHVFERFYRADKARSREDGGFGLGLAIVKWVAESHRGTVDLESEVGAGSVFTVTLPRAS